MDINITYEKFIDFYNKRDFAKFIKTSENHIKKNYIDFYLKVVEYDFYNINENIIKTFPCKIWSYLKNDPNVPICPTCNKTFLKFKNIESGYRKFCSRKCSTRSINSLEKQQATNLKKYGFKSAMSDKKILNKKLETSKKNCLIKYGVTHYNKSDDYTNKQEQIKITKLKEIGLKYSKILMIDGEMRTIKCYKCLKDYTRTYHFIHQRIKNNIEPCTNCNPLNYFYSKEEKELLLFIQDNYKGTILNNDRTVLEGRELDIYLPDLNLAFEFNGVYWHSELHKDKDYHLDKTNKCLKKNIHLIHIYEDDWNIKKDVVKSRILNLLGKSKRIYARKCVIKEVGSSDSRTFLNDNHIQGFVGSKVKIGLYHENILVSLMTFGGLRKNLGQTAKDGSYELLRFCNSLNTTVLGGASRLFKHFINDYTPEEIISYADRSWSKGELYKKLGFKFINNTGVNYFYVVDNIKRNRYGYRKDILVKEGYDSNMTEHEIMINRDIYRIYDSGSIKYQWN